MGAWLWSRLGVRAWLGIRRIRLGLGKSRPRLLGRMGPRLRRYGWRWAFVLLLQHCDGSRLSAGEYHGDTSGRDRVDRTRHSAGAAGASRSEPNRVGPADR